MQDIDKKLGIKIIFNFQFSEFQKIRIDYWERWMYNKKKEERRGIMPHYRSNAEEIRYYAKELLQDGQMHTRDEITQYVKAHSLNADNFTAVSYTHLFIL